RGPAGGGPAEEAGSEEKEARCSSGPPASACCWPGALSLGSGILRDQLSLAAALVSIDSRVNVCASGAASTLERGRSAHPSTPQMHVGAARTQMPAAKEPVAFLPQNTINSRFGRGCGKGTR